MRRLQISFVGLLIGALSFTDAVAGPIDSLYYLCDGGNELWQIHRYDGGKVQIGDAGVSNIETICYWPGTETLYAANDGDFGSLNYDPATMPGTNLFSLIGEIDGGGTANGSEGAQTLNDVDGLSFDPWTSILWASNRRAGNYDLLFQINPATGQFVPNAFGAGIDYIVIDGTGVYYDIDDIAISPVDGKMYTVATQAGSAQVLEINKYTGEVNAVVGTDQDDVEGMAYHNDGTFWGTVGTRNEFWQINPATGEMTNLVDITDAQCTDPESIAALVADINLVSGTVWNDADFDGVLDGGETGITGVTVELYWDANGDSIVNAGDQLLQQAITDGTGSYSFQFAALGNLIARVAPSSVPGGYAFTTDNLEAAEFTGFGQTNLNNEFGLATGPDSDGDGIPDFAEGGPGVDSDFDGVDNYLDIDSDNDGILDSVEGLADCDADGVFNYIDKDSDNDGIPDAIEANSGLQATGYFVTQGWFTGADSDGDGLLDNVDNAPGVAYTGASTSTLPRPDTDGDGVYDECDKDSDYDGILDVKEAGGTDADMDGVIDGFVDNNGDGYFDDSNFNYLPITNTDQTWETTNGLTLLPDYLDRDSDNDGLTDLIEGLPSSWTAPTINADVDGDGVFDVWDVDQGGSPGCEDTDGDGILDFRDADSENDGEDDYIEGNDANSDGIADWTAAGVDTDNDGLDDNYDTTPGVWGGTTNAAQKNFDGDDEPDWRDVWDTINPGEFWYVCDASDQLWQHNRSNGSNPFVGPTGVLDIEAIAYWNGTLYGANAGFFGTFDQVTGAFNTIAEIDNGGANANGVDGAVTLNDVDGLTFDPWTGILWAAERNGAGGDGDYDYLFQIDVTTGQFIADAFGTGVDYIEVDGSGVYDDIDDMAIDPLSGTMYAVSNNGVADQLIQINKQTGAVVVATPLSQQDVEGLAFHNDGTLWGSRGTSPGTLWEIDPSNGTLYNSRTLSCGDVEAFAGLVAPVNTIMGRVWDDLDTDQVIDGGEGGIAGVTVKLYYDSNGNGVRDGGDVLIQTVTTPASGNYQFVVASIGSFILELDITTLPASYGMTTDNIEVAVFTDNTNFRERDINNNFGATLGSDCDGDGIPDFTEGGVGVDSDGDGVDDMCDLDSDNDGITDAIEQNIDSDGDGIVDRVDLDSDNDGIPDALEANLGAGITEYKTNTGRLLGTDSDGDGLIDAVDSAPGVAYGGSTTTQPVPDSDGDGLEDFRDGDSDNDGILDITEANGVDVDGDGQHDSFSDGNGDGYHDALNASPLTIDNTDSAYETGAGLPLLPNYIDMDSDGDGIPDAREGQFTNNYNQPTIISDNDNDGIIDFWDVSYEGVPIDPVDIDNDGTPDYLDDDTDNDSVSDIIEGNDNNADGVADSNASGIDADGDGIDDTFDASPGTYGGQSNVPLQNTDGDAERDWRDTDDDNDGIQTALETADINPVNGTPDYLEASPCPVRFTVNTTTTTGNADAVAASTGVSGPANALGAPDGGEAVLGAGDQFDLDLTDVIPGGVGNSVTVTWRKVSGGGQGRFDASWSLDNVSYTPIATYSTSSTTYITTTVPITSDARYIRIVRNSRTIGVDALAYSFTVTGCQPDWDMDGVLDVNDVDDDNDGILDSVEGAGDADGDGVPNHCDLDSDNDGIMDAVEASASGNLPANMTAQGSYPVAYVVANDFNGNGLCDDADPAAGNPAPADPDTDLDGFADRIDLDTDADGILDAVEANTGVLPTNMDNNGQYPSGYATANDSDGDGIVDDVDSNNGGTVLANPDSDGNGVRNWRDTDSDGDGNPDVTEGFDPATPPCGGDADSDGLDDCYDPDAGGTTANLPDLDCNGVMDYLDVSISTAQSGDYNDPATWVGGVVPASTSAIQILNGHTVDLTGNTTVATISIDATGALDIHGYTLSIGGGLNVSGTFAASTGTVVFNGAGCPQDICGGDILFPSLIINNASGVNVTCGDVAVEDSLTLNSGCLDVTSANSFTLASDASGTSTMSTSGTGCLTGPVTLQRYKTGCVEGFFPYATPFSTVAYSDLSSSMLIWGFTNAPYEYDPSNTYWYDESVPGVLDSGYVEPSDYFSSLVRGRGYFVYQGMSAYPLNITTQGSVDLTDFVFPVQQTLANGVPDADGYNLMGNPYPGTLLWDMNSGGGWVNVGCCDAVFIWDECNDQYESFAAGVGTNGGDGIIPRNGAFWIKAHVPGASLRVTQDALINDPGRYRDNMPEIPKVLRLLLADPDGDTDEAAIRLKDGADEGMDLPFDAGKLCSNANPVREIYTVAGTIQDGMAMSVNALPDNGADRTVEVMVRAPELGTYSLKINGIESFPEDMCIVVEDNLTGTMLDPRADTSAYNFTLTGNYTFENRFTVHMSYPMETTKVDATCHSGADGVATVAHPGTGPFEITWKDAQDHVLQTTNNATGLDTLSGLLAGDYTVYVTDLGAPYCNDLARVISIGQPDAIVVEVLESHAGCEATPAGEVNITPFGGTLPYSYSWSNGTSAQDATGLASGTYHVTITDALGCTTSATGTVDPTTIVTASFEYNTDTINLYYGEALSLTNSSLGALYYVWDFGDSSGVSTSPSTTHQYVDTGNYTVTLSAVNGFCVDSAYLSLTVVDFEDPGHIGVENPQLQGDIIRIFEANSQLVLQLELTKASRVSYDLLTVAGKVVQSDVLGSGEQFSKSVPLDRFAAGTYLVRVKIGEQEVTRKIVLSK